ncbi:GntR family transcriptional regulator [Cohaesibacter sp. CAU 1516]|uniref:GntR family transcriptional regulator n=1 Tax=Cohaesibacter sp. CAU 1516 TaxID=2576038 RepID=UPI0032B27258
MGLFRTSGCNWKAVSITRARTIVAPNIGYQEIRTRILERIRSKQWPLGSALPSEVALAAEFKCARATVNRALVLLAEEGIIDRKRKAGSRVSRFPKKLSKIELKLIRTELEECGQSYQCKQLARSFGAPPVWSVEDGSFAPQEQVLHIESLHFGDGKPVQHQRSWINATQLPQVVDQSFDCAAPCEWLLQECPLCNGTYWYEAVALDASTADHLGLEERAPVILMSLHLICDGGTIARVEKVYSGGFSLTGSF